MIVFYDPGHSVHNPEREYTSGGAIPYPECADRAHGIGAALKEAGFTLQPPPMSPCPGRLLRFRHHTADAWNLFGGKSFRQQCTSRRRGPGP